MATFLYRYAHVPVYFFHSNMFLYRYPKLFFDTFAQMLNYFQDFLWCKCMICMAFLFFLCRMYCVWTSIINTQVYSHKLKKQLKCSWTAFCVHLFTPTCEFNFFSYIRTHVNFWISITRHCAQNILRLQKMSFATPQIFNKIKSLNCGLINYKWEKNASCIAYTSLGFSRSNNLV